MLGVDVQAAAERSGHEVVALSRGELDITDRAAVHARFAEARPEAVVNCAAYTNVDGAEADRDGAYLVNATGAGNVAAAAAEAGARIVHVSSDYVFDGRKPAPYVESDAPGPLSVYGASKLAGEQAVAEFAPHSHHIVRSSWLFGASGPCFPATMLRLAAERDELTVVDDQIGCPTFTGHLAPALVSLAADTGAPTGVLHVAAAGQCSWYEFAASVFAAVGVEVSLRSGTTADLDRPAPRPANSAMRTERGPSVPRLPEWSAGLRQYLELTVAAR
jgi:dTDP-4-dehydrorhamnose reductase